MNCRTFPLLSFLRAAWFHRSAWCVTAAKTTARARRNVLTRERCVRKLPPRASPSPTAESSSQSLNQSTFTCTHTYFTDFNIKRLFAILNRLYDIYTESDVNLLACSTISNSFFFLICLTIDLIFKPVFLPHILRLNGST